MATPRGRFVWHELVTSDPDAAIRFYTKVIGWQVEAWKGDPTYRMWTMSGASLGGLMRLPEAARRMNAPPSWLTYISTPDVDATVRQATSLGGRVVEPARDLPDVGRFAVLADPQGAVFSVYKPAREQAPEKGELGDFSWHELATTDYRAAWDFYRALFAWTATKALDLGPAGVYWMFDAGGDRGGGGMYNKPPDMPVANWLPYILVRHADQAAETAKRLGARIFMGPMDVPTGDRIAAGMDLQGAAFAVYSRPEKPAPRTRKKPARPKSRKTARKKPAKQKPKTAKRRR